MPIKMQGTSSLKERSLRRASDVTIRNSIGKPLIPGLHCTLSYSFPGSMSSPKQATCSSSILRLLFLSALTFPTRTETTEFSFPQFSSNISSIRAFGDTKFNEVNHSWIMNAKSAANSTPTCSLLMYNGNPIPRIQDSTSGTVASFSTSFTFKFTTRPQQKIWDTNTTDARAPTTLAFVISTYNENQNSATYIQDTANYAAQPGSCIQVDRDDFFLVVFDTSYNSNKGEPSNNFIGILDGMSNQVFKPGSTYNLCGNHTHCSYLSNGGAFTAWIDFTPQRTFQVRLVNGSYSHEEKPLEPLLQYLNYQLPTNMGDYILPKFLASSSQNDIQTHEISSWNFYSTIVQKKMSSSRKKRRNLILEVCGIVVILFIVGFILSIWLIRRHHFLTLSYTLGPHVFSYKELCKATNNFDENEKLGSGGFGTVYRGSFDISGNDTLLAVKRINYESKHAEATFIAEISSLSQIKHGNVVQLQGWCHEKGRLLLVYDYMSNGSLNEWLHDSNSSNGEPKAPFSWKMRYEILKGVAIAIEYLHKDCPQCILHRDIKSSNVMLDANFKAHLGDFGLARLMDHKKLNKTTMAAGTIGYMAPEVAYTGKATKESDVYSFGILILEVVCGKRPLDLKREELDLHTSKREDHVLLYKVWQAHETRTLLNIVDERMHKLCIRASKSTQVCHNRFAICGTQTQPCPCVSFISDNVNNCNLFDEELIEDFDNESMENMMVKNILHLGLLCCLPDPKARPTMGQVIQILQQIGNIENVDYASIKESIPPLPDMNPLERAHIKISLITN